MRRSVLTLAMRASRAAAIVAPAIRAATPRPGRDVVTASETWRSRISNHGTFTHDSLDSLGYDWGRIADPAVEPVYPLRVYLPRTTEEVIHVVKEAQVLGQRLVVRNSGHSSNDLVTPDRGSVLLTQHLNAVLALDEVAMTVRVQAGAALARIDDWLAEQGYGLPLIGSHGDISAGGFASVGGYSAASHRYGMFVDTVEALEYVGWDGNLIACSRGENRDHFYRVLAGTGQYGVIVTVTIRIIAVEKYITVVETEQPYFRKLEDFIAASARYFAESPETLLAERGVWADFSRGKRELVAGQFCAYRPTEQTAFKRLRDRISYGYLHGIGLLTSYLPPSADKALKYAGLAGTFLSPKYGTIKNVEFFTDKTLDYTVGDPSRMIAVLVPPQGYAALFRASYDLMREFRERYGCFTFITVYVKGIRSEYLSHGDPSRHVCELMFFVGVNPRGMTPQVLDELISRFDDLCIAHGALRYMHTKTVKDPERRRLIDPNTYYAERFATAHGHGVGAPAAVRAD